MLLHKFIYHAWSNTERVKISQQILPQIPQFHLKGHRAQPRDFRQQRGQRRKGAQIRALHTSGRI